MAIQSRPSKWVASIALALAGVAGAHAQSWPVKPIRLVVPFPAGGGVDTTGRVVGQKLSEALGQPVVIDNRAGAAGSLGVDHVAKSPADGYHLAVSGPGALTVAPVLYAKFPYDPVKDLQPVSLLVMMPFILVAHPSVPANDPKALVALAKASPGKLNVASGGTATATHLVLEMFNILAGVKMIHVSYKGTNPALADLMGGHADLFFSDPSAVALVRAKKLKAVGVTSLKRYPALPEVPTIDESAVKGFDATNWYPLLAPAATPKEIVARLTAETHKALADASVRERLSSQGLEPNPAPPEEVSRLIREDLAKWGKVVRTLGIKLE